MFAIAWLACAANPPPIEEVTPVEEVTPAAILARPQPTWIHERALAAERRLADDAAGTVILESISASGGLRNWYALSPLSFHFDYQPRSGKKPRDTSQIVDLWRSRAVHTWVTDERVTFGWDGERAWTKAPPGVALPINARFWALTPYYFVGMPFVLADEGVKLAVEGEGTFEGHPCTLVRVGFADGTGDAPDDAYVVYVSNEDRRVVALRYTVTYPGFFPDGGSSPWKILAYDDPVSVEGIRLPSRLRTYRWDESTQGPGELVTEITSDDYDSRPDLPLEAFAMPEGAEVQTRL